MEKQLQLLRNTFLFFIVAVFATIVAPAQVTDTIVSLTPSSKNVLLEEYTGIYCQYCPDGHRIANEIAAANPGRVNIINVHAGTYTNGQYMTQYGSALLDQTGLQGFPAGTINRHVFADSVTILNRGSWSWAASQIMASSSPVNIAAEGTLDFATRTLHVRVQLYYTGLQMVSSNMLNLAIVQDNVLGTQSGMNMNPSQVVDNQYKHMHMLRHLITGQWGETITAISQGTLVERTYDYVIPEQMGSPNPIYAPLEDLRFIAFVCQGHQEVLNSIEVPIQYTNIPEIGGDLVAVKSVDNLECDNHANATFDFKNRGSNTITSLTYTYFVNDVAVQTLTWNGNIPSMQTGTINLPVFDLVLNTNNVVTVQVTAINGVSVNCESQSVTIKKNVYSCTGAMTLTIATDMYASETTFNIFDPNGNVVLSGGPWSNLSSVGTTVRTFTFDPQGGGCYRLEVYDSYGDGINSGYGAGYFSMVLNQDNTQLFYNNGKFGSQATYMLDIAAQGPPCDTVYSEFSEEAIGSYTWNGQTYTQSGDYVQTFPSAQGCDSVVTLHLTVTPPAPVSDGQPCPGTPTVTDIDGNVYNTVKIGEQCWTKENLRVKAGTSGADLFSETNPYYYIPQSPNTFGYYYNWPAAMIACPAGWHLPSNEEWTALASYVGSQSDYTCGGNSSYIAKALASQTGWNSCDYDYGSECFPGNQNVTLNNATGFSAVPAGICHSGLSYDVNYITGFWTSTEYGTSYAYSRGLGYMEAELGENNEMNRLYGYSVRCLRSDTTTAQIDTSCSLIIEMHDSYGDGWNGNKILVHNHGTVQEVTLANGSDGTMTVTVYNGPIQLEWVSGEWPDEVSFNISGTSCISYSGGAQAAEGVFFSSEIDCSNNGVAATPAFSYWMEETNNSAIVHFQNNSTNAENFIWDFGDGTTSTEQSPVHEYLFQNGCTYSVTLSASNSSCENFNSITSNVVLSSYAHFTYWMENTCNSVIVHFQNQSSGNYVYWYFGDGAESQSMEYSPVYEYTASGNYQVSVWNECGSYWTYVNVVIPNLNTTFDTVVCASDLPITWRGHVFTGPETYTETFITSNNCDSTVTLNLTVGVQTVILEDDFNDGVINPSKWTYTGNAVLEEDGLLKLQQNVTDQDVHLQSVNLDVPIDGKVSMNRRFMVHRSDNSYYGNYYYGRTFFYLNGNTNNSIRIEYNYTTYEQWYGTYLVYSIGGDEGRIRLCDAIFDTWLTERVDLDFTTGVLTYKVDTLTVSASIPALVSQAVDSFCVSFYPSGWWTGHQHYMDYVSINGADVPDLVTTSPVSGITASEAICGGNISANDCFFFAERGVCWSTSHNPTVADAHTTDGSGVGTFTSQLTGLASNTTYYVRAYSMNSMGTAYGEEVTFTTAGESTPTTFACGTDKMTDVNGNEYETVLIGAQCWTKTNLRVAPTGATNGTPSNSTSYTTPYYYINSDVDAATYGYYYNWEAAKLACPSGWHLPSNDEWTLLTNFLSGLGLTLGTSGFNALPAGTYANYDEPFVNVGLAGDFWSSTSESSYKAWCRSLDLEPWSSYTHYGRSVRCLRGDSVVTATLPTITTGAVSNVTETSATSGGNVTDDGGATITERGVCWSTSVNPTVADAHTSDGAGAGAFTSSMTGLTSNTIYYVRAYATNSVGTAYGEHVMFTTANGTIPATFTCGTDKMIDADGNKYETVLIGTQCWSKTNLRTTHYVDGTPITLATPSGAHSVEEPQYYYDNTTSDLTLEDRGYFYNLPAVMHGADFSDVNPSGVQGICPAGWHVPSDAEWGLLMQTTGNAPETQGFSLILTGYLVSTQFEFEGQSAYFWTTSYGGDDYWGFSLGLCRRFGAYGNYWSTYTPNPSYGLSVRCLKDENNGSDTSEVELPVGPLFEFREIGGADSIHSIEANPGEQSMFEMYIRKNDQDENTKVFVEFQICKDGVPMTNDELASTLDNYTVVGPSGITIYNSRYSFEYTTSSQMSYVATLLYNVASDFIPQSNLGFSNSNNFDWFWLHFISDRKITVNLGAWKPGTDGIYTIRYAVVVAGDSSNEFMYMYDDMKRIGGNSSHLNLTVKDTIAYDYFTIYVGDTTSSPVVVNGQPCPGTPTVTDHEGNVYNTVQIGNQCWMKENLRTTTSPSTGTYLIPAAGTGYTYTGKQAFWYNNDSATYASMNYGLLYNWNAAVDTFNTAYGETSVNNDNNNIVNVIFNGYRRGICPAGWHLPSDAEWTALTDYVSSRSEYVCGNNTTYIAKALANNVGWYDEMGTCVVGDNQAENNATGFSIVPAGGRAESWFYDASYFAPLWSSSQNESISYFAWSRYLSADGTSVYPANNSKYYGFSVRCILNDSTTSATLPTVTTGNVSDITATSATCGGNVTDDGGATVTERGVCWSTSQNPTIADAHTSDGTGIGAFTSSMTGLTSNTTYYVRAYATNSEGTAYGEVVAFTTMNPCDGIDIALSGSQNICESEPVVLTANVQANGFTPENLHYTWYESGQIKDNMAYGLGDSNEYVEYLYARSEPYRFSVEVSYGDGCVIQTGEYLVYVHAMPMVQIIANEIAVCEGGDITLQATINDYNPLIYYQWYRNGVVIPGATQESIIDAPPTGINVYSVEAALFGINGCSSNDEMTINVEETPATPVVTVNNTVICEGGQVTLTVANPVADATYTWYRNGILFEGATQATIVDAPATIDGETSTYVYNVIASLYNSGCVSGISEPIAVTVAQAPIVIIDGNPNVCFSDVDDENVVLTAWVNGSVDLDAVYTWYMNGQYRPNVAGFDNVYRELWGPSNGNPYAFTVEVITGDGCVTISDPFYVNVYEMPAVQLIASETDICVGGTTIINADVAGEGNISYSWSVGNYSGSTYAFAPDHAGTFTITVTATDSWSGCSSYDEITINVNDVPATPVVTVNNATIFEGGQVTLTVANPVAGATYTWYRNGILVEGATQSTLVDAPITIDGETSTYVYSVMASLYNSGCVSGLSEPVDVTVSVMPTAVVAVDGGTLLCEGGFVTLHVDVAPYNDPTYLYQWYEDGVLIPGATAADYAVIKPARENAYNFMVMVSAMNGDFITTAEAPAITVIPQPEVIIDLADGYDATVCEGGSTALQALVIGGYGTTYYQWYKNGLLLQDETDAVLNINDLMAGSDDVYAVSVAQEGPGCGGGYVSASISSLVTVEASATVILADSIMCEGGSMLTAILIPAADPDAQLVYTWYKDDAMVVSGPSDYILASDPGLYKVVVDKDGCISESEDFYVTYHSVPQLQLTASENDICVGSSTTINANVVGDGDISYSWSVGYSGSTYTFAPDHAGTFTFTVTATDEWSGCMDSEMITIKVNNAVYVTVTNTACESYNWNDSVYTLSGDYTQTFTAANGCDSVVTLHLTINQPTTGDTTAMAYDSFDWYEYINLTQSGDYMRTFTNVAGCDSVVTLHLTINYTTVTGDTTAVWCDLIGVYEHTAPTNLIVTPVTEDGNDTVKTQFAWTQTGDPDHWEILYVSSGGNMEMGTSIPVYSNPCVLTDIPLGNSLDFYVRAVCGEGQVSQWCGPVIYPLIIVQDTMVVAGYFSWNGKVFISDTVLVDTISVPDGYDSVVTYHIYVTPTPLSVLTVDTCDSYTLNGQTYYETGDYVQSIPLGDGVDSLVVLYLIVNQPTTGVDVQTACDSFMWIDGVMYTESNSTATYTLTNAAGCDSVVTLNLTLNHTETAEFAETACVSFEWNGETFTTSGDYTQTFTNVAGCDSVVTLHLIVNQPTTGVDVQTACDSFTWIDGVTYTESNSTATYTLTNAAGCDSVVTLNLTLNHAETAEFAETACVSFEWNGQTYTTSGDYTQTFTAANGCDSVVTLHLTVDQPTTGVDVQTACNSFTWIDGVTYTESNSTATYTLTNAAGCDSVVTLNLTLNHAETAEIAETACGSYEWNGETFTTSGDYTQTFTAANGCDSVVTLHLIINQPTVGVDVQTACDTFTWIDGVTYTESNSTVTYTLTNAAGCDSVVTLNLTLNHAETAEFAETACGSYEWNGETFTTSGDYTQTFTAANGCDSVVTLHLTINQPTTGIDVQTACDTFTWIDGVTYTESNSTATYTLTNAAGCDSVVTLNLTLNHAETVGFAETACGSYEWNGETFTTSGDYTQTFTAANGCDSVVTLHLIINQPTTGVDVQTACDSFTWIDGVTYTESNNTATYTLTNAAGCDSVVTLNLTLNHAETAEIAETACVSFEWNGQTYTTSGDYTQTFTAANGCDSVVTLHLTINQPTAGVDVQTACDTFTWIDGVTYTESNNTATYTLTNAAGCDSVVTLNLTLNHAETAEFAETACVSFEWNGQTYTTSGDYTQTFTAANGCDSVVTLHLIINQPTAGIDVQTACDTFTWIDGVTYTESNSTATYTLTNAAGCDSVVTLNLTLNHAETAGFAETACGSYEWNGETFTTSGDYTQTFTAANGCDSVVTLHLTINQPTAGIDVQTACDTFTWIDGVTYTESNSTATYTLTNAAGCDSVVTLNLTLNHAETAEFAETACGSFEWNGETFTTTGDYTLTFTNAAGCDSVVTLHLIVNPVEESEFSITTEDSCYIWNAETYCTSGDYTQTLQTVHGCDSVVTLHLTITVGVNDYDGFDFMVYPNPTNDVVNVQITNHNSPITDFHVYDAYGKLIRVVDGIGANDYSPMQTAQIDLSGLANGLYFVKAVADGNVVAVRKVIKN